MLTVPGERCLRLLFGSVSHFGSHFSTVTAIGGLESTPAGAVGEQLGEMLLTEWWKYVWVPTVAVLSLIGPVLPLECVSKVCG